MRHVVPLDQATAADRVGGKAVALADLLRAGVAVPAGFCVSASALEETMRAHGLDRLERDILDHGPDTPALPRLRAALAEVEIPTGIVAAIGVAYRELSAAADEPGWPAVAVRSSGMSEDTALASFAGVFDSYLNITDPRSLLDAVRGCWASRWAEPAVAYRQRLAVAADHAMGVLVQLLVPASASGVLFTADPVTADRSRLVVNSTHGLSTDLLSGHASCDTFVVDRASGRTIEGRIAAKDHAVVPSSPGGVTHRSLPPGRHWEPSQSPAALAALAELATAVERVRGPDQDIEFAWQDGRLYALQARPITAGPAERPSGRWRPRDGYWLRADELFPTPVCTWSRIMFQQFVEGLNRARALWHSPCTLRVTTVDGWMYMSEELREPSDPAAHRHDYQDAITALTVRAPRRWRTEWRAAVQRRSRDVLATDLRDLPDDALLAGLHAWLEGRAEDECLGGIIGMVPTFALAKLAGLDAALARTLARDVLDGLPSMLGELEEALWSLARDLEALPRARRALRTLPAPRALAALRALPEASAPLAAFLREHGYHGIDGIESVPWREDPTPLVEVLRSKIGSGEERPAVRAERLAARRERALRRVVAAHPRQARAILDLVPILTACLPLGQDRYMALTELGHAAARHQLAEIGRRLVARGLLAEPLDTLHLALDELDAALRTGIDQTALVTARRQARRRASRARPPATLGRPVTLQAMPYVIDSILTDRGSGLGTTAPADRDAAVDLLGSGIAGSGGRYTGPARVCPSLADAVSLRRGDVLVCETTTPAWTQYYGLIGAVVTERGGLLSHPAVVAREYGIPAVIGVTDASARIASGQTLDVDGDRGLVHAGHP